MSNPASRRFMVTLSNVDGEIQAKIERNLPKWASMMQSRIAWSTSDGGFMPVDTGYAINNVTVYDAKHGRIVIGSKVEYMVYIEEGSPTIRAHEPYRRGMDYTFEHDINQEIDSIMEAAIDDGIDEYLNGL